jgi:hypothetical protein
VNCGSLSVWEINAAITSGMPTHRISELRVKGTMAGDSSFEGFAPPTVQTETELFKNWSAQAASEGLPATRHTIAMTPSALRVCVKRIEYQ